MISSYDCGANDTQNQDGQVGEGVRCWGGWGGGKRGDWIAEMVGKTEAVKSFAIELGGRKEGRKLTKGRREEDWRFGKMVRILTLARGLERKRVGVWGFVVWWRKKEWKREFFILRVLRDEDGRQQQGL